MKFGVIDNFSEVDYTFPPIHTAPFAKAVTPKELRLYIGAPVWAEKNYVGTLFPPKTSAANYLKAYARQCNSIEVNATRYGTPKLDIIRKWRDDVPDEFRFSMKFPQVITHRKNILDRDALFKLDEFLVALNELGPKNGMAFAVMANYFRPNQLETLEKFIHYLPHDMTFSIELRDPEWYHPAVLNEWLDLMKVNSITPVLTDTPGRRDILHFGSQTGHCFVRYVGRFNDPSDAIRIRQWVHRIEELIAQGNHTIWFYAHQGDDRTHIIGFFNALIGQLNTQLNLNIPLLTDYSTTNLFTNGE
jgi:uncharacterized protein YecE (DUF72 family)